jgi:hypothetical protein
VLVDKIVEDSERQEKTRKQYEVHSGDSNFNKHSINQVGQVVLASGYGNMIMHVIMTTQWGRPCAATKGY